MNTAAIDALIDQLYQGVVAHPRGGHLLVYANEIFPGQGAVHLIAPPSPAGIAKLQELRDTYSWTIPYLP